MSTRLIRIVGVGACLPPAPPRNRLQWLTRGWQGQIPVDIADRWVDEGVAVPVEDDVAAEQAVTLDPAGTDDLQQLGVRRLRQIARDRGVSIPAGADKATIVRLLADDPDAPTGGLADMSDDELLEQAAERDLDVPPDADRDAVLALLQDDNDDEDGEDA
ncbi:MAG: hypothetical protein M0P31_13660 [Solirubrobacteraceae bacterium]|nr:hypothetical protein [Solirubrobacteraceae bacterium]